MDPDHRQRLLAAYLAAAIALLVMGTVLGIVGYATARISLALSGSLV